MHHVKIEQFEGPLDLLLEIIEAKKLPLVGISLFKITDQFLQYAKSIKERPTEELVHFLHIASRLALLKSRELVPSQNDTDEAEGDIGELERQLALYQPFRKAAKELAKLDRKKEQLYARRSFIGFNSVFHFPKTLKKKNLTESIEELLNTTTLPQRIPQARIKDTESIEDCVKKLKEIIKDKETIKFLEFIKEMQQEARIVNFLGIIEISRTDKIQVKQNANFKEITLSYGK